jgi:hypothetical protein
MGRLGRVLKSRLRMFDAPPRFTGFYYRDPLRIATEFIDLSSELKRGLSFEIYKRSLQRGLLRIQRGCDHAHQQQKQGSG